MQARLGGSNWSLQSVQDSGSMHLMQKCIHNMSSVPHIPLTSSTLAALEPVFKLTCAYTQSMLPAV